MSQHFSSEQLNFFKFSAIVLNEFPKALRQVFKAMWDNRYVIPSWDDSVMVRNMFQHHEGGNMTHVPTDKSYMEWDCTALFQATLYARSFVQSGGRKRETNLYDLYVKPRCLKDGAFHHSVWTQTRNNEETLALALDQLRLLRNALFHQTNTQSIDSSTFHNYLVSAEGAFDALGLSFESIEKFLNGAVLDFHASSFKELLDWVHKEKNAAIKSKQFENHLSEIKASCNTKVTDHGGPQFENNCGFPGSETKSSAVDGNTKVVQQAQKFQDLEQTADNSPRCSFQEAHPSSGHTYDRINEKFLKTRGISGSRNVCEIFVGKLDKALNFRQSEYISEARNEVRELFDLIKREDARDFRKPTRYCLEVVSHGNDLFFDNSIDEGSQKCRGCNSKISDYFCAICKHFTSLDKNPFHCDKCGICRIHRDKSFHCDVCNVCLDKRLQGKHKCRPDSGHDECCICLEDAFSGCQILPCSHKVHKDCAIAMIQNGIRTCPICRHPLFQQPEGTDQ